MNRILNIFAVFLLISCAPSAPSPETKFEKLGISFTCPAGWKITKEKNLNDQAYLTSVEKDGYNASGIMTINWLNDSIDLNRYLEIINDELGKHEIYKDADLNIHEPFETKFNDHPAVAAKFTMIIDGLAHEGINYCLYGNGKTINITRQEAVEDQLQNKEGFEIIEKSFLSK